MRIHRWFFLLPLASAFACSNNVQVDTLGDPASRVITPSGVIRGFVTYQGPHPCSQNGHIVGNAILLVFDRRNPPPPAGLGGLTGLPQNFVSVEGDALFVNEPRWGGSDRYCPKDHGVADVVTVSAPFVVSPMPGGSYIIAAFYDYTGNFLPTFKFRNIPEMGDIGGGTVDTVAALQPINQNADYMPTFLPVDVGIPRPVPQDAGAGTVPIYDIPDQGYVADNVQVTVGSALALTRPYFYAQGMSVATTPGTTGGLQLSVTPAQSSEQTHDKTSTTFSNTGIAGSVDINDPHYAPLLTIPQDIRTFAPPTDPVTSLANGANLFEAGGTSATGVKYLGLPHLRLLGGVGASQMSVGKASPFNMQLFPYSPALSDGTALSGQVGGFNVWRSGFLTSDPSFWPKNSASDPLPSSFPAWRGQFIPEGWPVPNYWPLVVLSKLVDDPGHTKDPAALTAQGSATEPVVIMQGITLTGAATPTGTSDPDVDSLIATASAAGLSGKKLGTGAGFKDGEPIIGVQDHLTVMLRPAAVCFNTLFDPNNSDKHGQLVTPYLYSESADYTFSGQPAPKPNTPVVPLDLLTNDDPSRVQVTNLIEAPAKGATGKPFVPGTDPPANVGCLPKGRYAINVVYPDGQAWTVPNEAGACTGTATGEGDTNWKTLTCTLQSRPVIQSQGTRAVVEIVGPTDPNNCKVGAAVPPTPAMCLPEPAK